MPPAVRPTSCAVLPAALAVLLAGCGAGGPTMPAPVPPAATTTSPFPSAGGRTLQSLRHAMPRGLRLEATVTALEPGRNRFGFLLLDRAQRPVVGTKAALYVADGLGAGARGPFPARDESLAVEPQYAGGRSAADQGGKGGSRRMYVVEGLRLGKPGWREVMAVVRLDGRLVASRPVRVEVRSHSGPPDVGQAFPALQTPAGPGAAAAGADPHADLHVVDLAAVLGREPVVVILADLGHCQVRACAQALDVAEQVHARYAGKAAFVHVDPHGSPELATLGAGHGPWTLVLDAHGRVAARFQGPLAVHELARAVQAVTSA